MSLQDQTFKVGKNELLTGRYVRWVRNTEDALKQDEFGMQNLPEGSYYVIDTDNEYALAAVMLPTDVPSSKHAYLIKRADLEAWLPTHLIKEVA
jgi:hypothetical protein